MLIQCDQVTQDILGSYTTEQFSWVWWPQTHQLFVTSEWLEFFGFDDYDPKSLTDNMFWARVHKDDLPSLMATSEGLAAGRMERGEEIVRMAGRHGRWAWILTRSVVLKKRDGKGVCVAGNLIDLSSLRLGSKFRLTSEGEKLAGYHAMLENSPDLTIRLDSKLSCIYVNPAVQRYAMHQVEHRPTGALSFKSLEPAHSDFIKRKAQEVFLSGQVIRSGISFQSTLRGEVSGEYTFWPELDINGNVKTVIAQFRDHTEHVRVEQRATLNEQRLSSLYTLNQMVNVPEEELLRYVVESIVDLTGSAFGYVFLPRNEECTYGRTVWSKAHYDTFPHQYLTDNMLPEDCLRAQKDVCGNFSASKHCNGDGVNPTHTVFDGSYTVMRYMHSTVFDGEKPVCIAGVSNRTTAYEDTDLRQLSLFINSAWAVMRRHHYTHSLERAKDVAERSNKFKDQFLANISHELRTPLNGMLSMLQLIDLEAMPADQREYIQTAQLSGQALLRIIGDILDISRMESGHIALQHVPFNLHEMLRSTINLFSSELANKFLTLSLEIDPSVPETLLGDDARMRQIIFNLLGNAIKFTEAGGLSIYCRAIRHRPGGKMRIYFAVSDTGIGIPEEQQAMVFDAFTQVDNSATRKYPGTGLGLSIVKRLVNIMGGNIAVESAPGEGTTLHFSIPFEACEAEQSVEEPKEPPQSQKIPLNILVAEDDAVSRLAITLFLQRCGHRVVSAENGAKALEALRLYDFHCLFTDIQMPGMDGLELVRRIRQGEDADITPSGAVLAAVQKALPDEALKDADAPLKRDLLVVAVSAHAMAGDKERFLQGGIDFYISKPVILQELEDILGRVTTALQERELLLSGQGL